MNTIDINECLTGNHNCLRSGPNRAECVNEPGGFRCSCSVGYELDPATLNRCDGTFDEYCRHCCFCKYMITSFYFQKSMNVMKEPIIASQLDYTRQYASTFQGVSSVPVTIISVLDLLMEDVKVGL